MANLRRVRAGRGGSGSRRPTQDREPLADGTAVRDTSTGREGTVLEHACQYAHPQAAPVYHYLVRWDDGQVQALGEAAFRPGQGVEILD